MPRFIFIHMKREDQICSDPPVPFSALQLLLVSYNPAYAPSPALFLRFKIMNPAQDRPVSSMPRR